MSDSPIVSIVIPTYNYSQYISEAMESAIAQHEPGVIDIEIIVVDDGSTDDVETKLSLVYGYLQESGLLRVIRQPHSGPSVARNTGIEAARGQFVMLLDADDVIYPGKVKAQLKALAGTDRDWALCDVLIIDDAKRRRRTASEQYNYAGKQSSIDTGEIAEELERSNFIPIMSPLIRLSTLRAHGIRFSDGRPPEDWYFWRELAAVARCVYVPTVFAEYRHRRTGRSRLPAESRLVVPNPEHPLRLNLGCGQPGKRSWHPMPGLVNMDPSLPGEWEWRFERGLPRFVDRSVAGITISHALMYLELSGWPAFLAETFRVLEPGGVIRITEDDTEHPQSSRRGGWKGSEPAVTLTGPSMARAHLEAAGFVVTDVDRETTGYRDRSLCQAQHGSEPDVFFIEGRRPAAVLFAPHNDDETLFAAFTILRHRPMVVVCFPSVRDYGDPITRELETRQAMEVLGGGPVEQWHCASDIELERKMRDLDARVRPTSVFAPHWDASHEQHCEVAGIARRVFLDRVTRYHTYNRHGKVRDGVEVSYEPEWIPQKLRALLRYETQLTHPRAYQFFLEDLREYVEPRS